MLFAGTRIHVIGTAFNIRPYVSQKKKIKGSFLFCMAEPFINNDMFILHLCSSEIVLFIDILCE